MKKICFVSTFFGTAEKFLHEQILALSKDYEITIVCDFIESDYEILTQLPVKYKKISIPRKISIWNDIQATWQLYKFFRKEKFWAIHSLSHKPGLVTPIAAILAGCNIRVYTFTGQYWADKVGFSRWVLKEFDWLIAKLNNWILVDGDSQRKFLIENKVIQENNSFVLGYGSISGVNMTKFHATDEVRVSLRNKFGISDNKVVYLYMGRLCRDKGISELIEAFNNMCCDCENAYLVFVGWDEDGYLEKIKSYHNVKEGVNFNFLGSTSEPEKVYQLGDVACFPSYREGFGLSVIEASALGLPVICSDVYGILDSYIDQITGLRCKAHDVDSLEICMRRLYNEPDLRKQFGLNGKTMVNEKFNAKFMTKCWLDYYQHLEKYTK